MYAATSAPPSSGTHVPSPPGVSRMANGMTSQSITVNSESQIRQMSPQVMYPPHSRHAQYLHQQHQLASAAAAGVRMVPHSMASSAMASRHLGLPATPGRPTSSGYVAMPARGTNSSSMSVNPMAHRQRLPHPSQMMEKVNVKQVPAVSHPHALHPQATHPQMTHPQATHPQMTHPRATHPQANHPQANYPHTYRSSGPTHIHMASPGHSVSHSRSNSVQGGHLIHKPHDAHPRFSSNAIAGSSAAQAYAHASKAVAMSAGLNQQRMTLSAQNQSLRGHPGHHGRPSATVTSQGHVMSGQGLVSVYTSQHSQHSASAQQYSQAVYSQSASQSRLVRPPSVSQPSVTKHPSSNLASTGLRPPHNRVIHGAMGPAALAPGMAFSRPRPPMPPLIKAAPQELPAQSTDDTPLDLSNPDGPLDLSVRSRKRAASPANSQDDVILVKVSQPKVRRVEQPPQGNYAHSYTPHSKYPQETAYNQSAMNSKYLPNRRLSQPSPQQMMTSPVPSIVKGHPGVMQHPMMQRPRHPGPQMMSAGSHYDSKWRMASPQPKDVSSNLYMTQGHMDARVDAKRQSEELIRNAFNMRFANRVEGFKQNSHDNSGIPAHSNSSNGFTKPAENQTQHSQSALKAHSEYRPLMQAGQPRTLEELTTGLAAQRPSLVSNHPSPHALQNNNPSYVRGSITQGLPVTERTADPRGPSHQTSSQPCDYSSRKDSAPMPAHSMRNPSEYSPNYVINNNKDPQGQYYPHSIQNNAHQVVCNRGIPQGFEQSSSANQPRSGSSDDLSHLQSHSQSHSQSLTQSHSQSHSQSHPHSYPSSGQHQPNHETPRGRSPSPEKDDTDRKRKGALNIIRIMHEFIQTRIEDPSNDETDPPAAAAPANPKEETSDQPHVVSHMGLPSGVRFHPSPEGVPRAPFKGERSHPDRTIPVANVNPIVQSNNPLLHPKKQMLYQSRLENSQKQSDKDKGQNDTITEEEDKDKQDARGSPGAANDTDPAETVIKKESSKVWRKTHMVPIKERFKSKKMYNKEQALQSIKSDGSKIRAKVPGRKPGRPRSQAPLMKKATKAMKQQMMGRPGKNPGSNGVAKACDDDTTAPCEKPDKEKSEFDFVSNDKEDAEHGKDTKTDDNENSSAGRRMKKRMLGLVKRGRPKTSHEKKIMDKQNKVAKRKGKLKKEISETESGSETRSRRGLHKHDLTVLTRHQAANVRSTRRGTLYNKNEAYEKELRRDEHRKLMLRIKRQTSWSNVTSRRKSFHHFQSRSFGSRRKLQLNGKKDDDTERGNGDTADGYENDDDTRDLDYGDTDMDDTNDEDDGRGDDTEPASDTLDLPKRNRQPKMERRKRKYKMRGRRVRLLDEESDLDQGEVGQELKAEFKKFVVSKDIGETLLHRAAKLGNMDLLMSCLESHCVNVNARDNAGYTPLHESCVKGHMEVTRLLLAHGADVNASAIDGTRPIHDAVDNERFEITRLLLSCGADIRLASVSGRAVLKVARTDRMKTLIKGYLHDLNGPDEDEDEGEEPAAWTFHASSSILGRISNSGYDVLADIPSEGEEGDDKIFFDLSDTPHLPAFHLCLDKKKGFRNYHRMEDVLSSGFVPRKNVDSLNLTICRVKHHLVADLLTGFGGEAESTPCSSDEMISFVEMDDVLLTHLNVEHFRINCSPEENVENIPPPNEEESKKSPIPVIKGSKSVTSSKVVEKLAEKDTEKSSDIIGKDVSDKENTNQSGEQNKSADKREVEPSEVLAKHEKKSTTTSPDTRSSTPISKAATLPVKLQENKKETIVKSVSASSLDKYDLKTAYGMWNIKPCSVPIQNGGANFMVGKTAIVSHSLDKYSFRSDGRAKFQTKITDYDKCGKQASNESKSLPAKMSPQISNSNSSSVSATPPSRPVSNANSSSAASPSRPVAAKSPENPKGSDVNITATSSNGPNNSMATSSSHKVTGNEVENVSTSASTISNDTAGSNMIKTEIKIGTVPEDCLAGLAQVSNTRRQSSCEQRSASPREAATPTSSQVAFKPEPTGQPRTSAEDPTDLPVLEKESSLPEKPVKEEKPVGVETVFDDVSDDREMPELTIEKAERGEGKKTTTNS